MSADTSTRKTVEYYRSEGKKAVTEGESAPDPTRLGQTTEAVLNELELAGKDQTPELFQVPAAPHTYWDGVLKELAQDLYRALGEAIAPPPLEVEVPAQVKGLLEECGDERKRLSRAIDGNGSNRERAHQLREHVFGGRTTPQTRPAWEAELKLNIAAIHGLGESAPLPVRAMIPRLQRVERLLAEAPVIAPGKKTPAPPSPRVLHAAMALHLALGDLLSHAAVTATSKRLDALGRIILPRKRSRPKEEKKQESGNNEQSAQGSTTPAQPPAKSVEAGK